MQTQAASNMTWRYEPAADLGQPLIERLRRFPREPDLTVYVFRSLAALICRCWLRIYHRLEIVGREHVPKSGSFILVANHASHLDILALLAALPLRKLHRAFPAAAQDYFFVSIPRLALAAVVVNALPFARKTQARHSLELCRQLLANPGNILILFPEGTRTTGRIGDFKPGIGLLAARAEFPIVPCHLSGTFNAWPKSRLFPRPRKVRLRIGAPRNYSHLQPTRESAEQISQDLHKVICEMKSL